MQLQNVEQKGILTVHRSGLPVSKDALPPVLVMMSGLPDSSNTWSAFAKSFESSYHVVTMAYPFMDQESLPSDRKWGYSTKEVTTAMLTLIQDYRVLGCSEIYLIGHDWGSIAALKYAQAYPETLTKVVFEDVGILDPAQNNGWEVMVIMCYQIFLVTLFVLSRFIGGTWWYKLLLHSYPWKSFGPLTVDAMPMEKLDTYPHKIYPCYQGGMISVTNPDEAIAKFANVPQLFVFGRKKRAMFHSQFYLDKLEATDGCAYKEYSGAGHWVHISHCDEMAADVLEFLAS